MRFLYRAYPDDPCNRQFEEAMANFEDPKKHFCPAPLDKMIGIMESFRTLDAMEEPSGVDKSLSAQINAVEQLRQQYEMELREDVNSQKTIDLYHKWYNEALVLFAGEISPGDEYFRVFKSPHSEDRQRSKRSLSLSVIRMRMRLCGCLGGTAPKYRLNGTNMFCG